MNITKRNKMWTHYFMDPVDVDMYVDYLDLIPLRADVQ